MSAIDPPPAPAILTLAPLRAWLRIARHATGFALVVAVACFFLCLGRLLLLPLPRWRERFTAALFRRSARVGLRALGCRIRVTGQAPKAPFLLVANHLSYLDVLVLVSHLDCIFLSKAEVRGWPLWGTLCSALGTLYIDQKRRRDVPRAIAEIEATLERGRGVAFFPEGTSSNGATVGAFRSPLLALPARLGGPVYTATLGYRTPPGEPAAADAVCFWGSISFGSHVLSLLELRAIEATLCLGPSPLAGSDRKLLAERLRAAVLERLEPMTSGTAKFR